MCPDRRGRREGDPKQDPLWFGGRGFYRRNLCVCNFQQQQRPEGSQATSRAPALGSDLGLLLRPAGLSARLAGPASQAAS